METARSCAKALPAATLCLLFVTPAAAPAQEVRPGVWAGFDVSSLPLPTSGYQVYFLGELHGLREIETIFGQYLAMLHTSAGLRDVALEEDAVYERDAQAYVEGRSDRIPDQLCLRAGLLRTVRRFNEGRSGDGVVRVHLVDIDTPAAAIRQHLLMLKAQIAAASAVRVPAAADINKQGLKTVERLKALTTDQQALRQLRTIEHSIRANQQGLEAGIGQPKGSPYLEDREQAITSNIQDLLRRPDCRTVLALYGSDHVSKARRKDGGPNRNRDFSPLALRLEEAGVKVFSLVTFPLSGQSYWRGRKMDLVWTAADGALASGEKLDQVLFAAQQPSLLYIDRRRERVRLPSQDITAFAVDAFLLLASATPMADYCAAR